MRDQLKGFILSYFAVLGILAVAYVAAKIAVYLILTFIK